MADEFSIRGAEDLAKAAAAIKATGNRTLKRELARAIREAAKPATLAIKASALAELPRRGGLGKKVAASRVSTRVRTSARSAGVRVQATNLHDIAAMNRGRLRHPVFGNRQVWVNQEIKAGWFSDPADATKPVAQQRVRAAMERVQNQLKN